MELNYDYIISYLCKNDEKKIEPKFLNDFDISDIDVSNLSYYFYYNNCSFDSILNSLIYILNIEDFYFDESKNIDSRNKMINQLSLENNDDLFSELCKKLDINILVLEEKIHLYSGSSIINLYNPFILLRKKDNIYYPICKDKKTIFYYQDKLIEEILESEINIEFEEFQLLDNLEEIIDDLLNNKKTDYKEKNDNTNDTNSIFLKENTIDKLNILNKLKKSELIEKILEKNDNNTEQKLKRLKKNDLINLLL